MITLAEAVAQHPRESFRDHIEKGERQREQIVRRFPPEHWPEMALGEYALGDPTTPKETYCWWIEFGSRELGSMRGGQASKHLIYFGTDGRWHYPEAYRSVEAAWEAVRGGFLRAFELAAAGRWDEIDALDALHGAPALRTKSLHVYFPGRLIPIYSRDHLRHFLRLLDRQEGEGSSYDTVRLNRALLDALRRRPELAGWAPNEMARLAYAWADPRETRRIVKIAPGHDGEFWDECLAKGMICVEWDDVGDLAQFESMAEFREHFRAVYAQRYNDHQPTVTKKAREVWTLRELEPGDLVVANRGTAEILGIGEVVEPGYVWDGERERYRHTLRVDWKEGTGRTIPPEKRWAVVTVAPIPADQYARMLAGPGGTPVQPSGAIPPPPLFAELQEALDRKGQAILYGPPGTGKTFQARRFAVWSLLRAQGREDAEAVIADPERFAAEERRLTTAQVARRVWWVVANPSQWSWDQLRRKRTVDYRYGRIQRNYPLVQKGDLVVGYQSTPDKRIMALARVRQGLHPAEDGPRIELEWVADVQGGPGYEEITADPILARSEPIRFRNQGTLFALTEDEAGHLLSLLVERDPSLRPHLDNEESIGALTRVTFHPSYSYEDFVEGFRPVDRGEAGSLALRLEDGVFKRVCREAQANSGRTYLVLIDEINRANVARVLGELITLLEKDKRGQLVTLPQSKESFTVPENVRVLGTMNTADRSIKLLDAALRRRFAFIELMPDDTLLRGATIEGLALDDFLGGLNRRIMKHEGREKQVGHSYLLVDGRAVDEPAEFARRFRQEILPLLQEYCYDDYSRLAEYLGDTLVDPDAQELDDELLADPSALVAALAAAFGNTRAEG
ncbi:MAG TPA: AAA family ATPase [Longimicrobiaceae bacterium]|nr:AAA family ATPase [Longimicrobiaceae bacterium]